MSLIFQDRVPEVLRAPRTLPGTAPLAPEDWLVVDEAYGAQMAERARLLAARRGDVLAMRPEAEAAAQELLEVVFAHLVAHPALGFTVGDQRVRCPDGREVALVGDVPLAVLGHILQEDLCVLTRPGTEPEHVLTGAVLCFPASWTLAQKIGRPLGAIHGPVESYDGAMAARVQRLFDGVRIGRPMWRSNLLRYDDPALFQPRTEDAPRIAQSPTPPFLRIERQCILRLPETQAVVFSIHTWLVRDR